MAGARDQRVLGGAWAVACEGGVPGACTGAHHSNGSDAFARTSFVSDDSLNGSGMGHANATRARDAAPNGGVEHLWNALLR